MRRPLADRSPLASEEGSPKPLAVTWLGHATALIELDGTRMLTDPVLRDRVGPLLRIGSPVDRAALGRLDAVLISHLHADHADAGSLRTLDQARVIGPAGSRRWLGRHCVGEVQELAPGDETELEGVKVRATPAVHDGRRWPVGSSAGAIGFMLEGSQTCYFAGDTDLYAGMSELAGRTDIALLPVGGWGPTVGAGHLDPVRAARAVSMIAPRVVIPIHWGTFALAWRARQIADPARPARRFAELVEEAAPEVDVRVLASGERTELALRSRAPAGPESR